MTREESLESGIGQAVRMLGEVITIDPERAAMNLLECSYGFSVEEATPDELEGFAVGLQLLAVEGGGDRAEAAGGGGEHGVGGVD